MRIAWSRSTMPASVGSTPRPLRTRRRRPNSSSRYLTVRLRLGCDIPRRSPAFDRFPVSQIVLNIRRSRSVVSWRSSADMSNRRLPSRREALSADHFARHRDDKQRCQPTRAYTEDHGVNSNRCRSVLLVDLSETGLRGGSPTIRRTPPPMRGQRSPHAGRIRRSAQLAHLRRPALRMKAMA